MLLLDTDKDVAATAGAAANDDYDVDVAATDDVCDAGDDAVRFYLINHVYLTHKNYT